MKDKEREREKLRKERKVARSRAVLLSAGPHLSVVQSPHNDFFTALEKEGERRTNLRRTELPFYCKIKV